MAKRKGGLRRGTRSLLRKNIREKGKLSIARALASYKPGERVVLKPEPAFQKGMFHPRFVGKVAVVKSKRGRAYEVLVSDGGKMKTFFVNPIHLAPLEGGRNA